jgi:hypothetical protein
MIAIGRVDGISAKIIIIITVIGTLSIMPVIHHNAPQKLKLKKITRGLTFNESPVSFGSI